VWISLFGTNKLGWVNTAKGARKELVSPSDYRGEMSWDLLMDLVALPWSCEWKCPRMHHSLDTWSVTSWVKGFPHGLHPIDVVLHN